MTWLLTQTDGPVGSIPGSNAGLIPPDFNARIDRRDEYGEEEEDKCFADAGRFWCDHHVFNVTCKR